jgi:hypothetical protein
MRLSAWKESHAPKPHNHSCHCFELFICCSRIMLKKMSPTHPAYREEEIPLTGGWQVLTPERPERGGPCWLVKLRRIGTQRLQMKGGPSLVGSLGSSCWYKRLLSCLKCSDQPCKKYFSPFRTLFQFMCPLPPSSLGRQSSRAACLWLQQEELLSCPHPLTCTFGGLSLILIPNLNL